MQPPNEAIRKRRRRNQAGFSLIELMVVIAIIAMLAAVVGYNLLGSLEDAEITAAKAQIKNFQSALIGYRLAFKRFPSTDEGLDVLINNDKKKFLDANAVPLDPWSNEYVYVLDSSNDYEIISYGADGMPGGEGVNIDISSKSLAENSE